MAALRAMSPDLFCDESTALKLTEENLTVNLRPVSSSASPEHPDPLRGSTEQEGYFAAQQDPLRGSLNDAALPRPNERAAAQDPQQGEPLGGSKKSALRQDVEARLAARSGGWEWAQVQYWSNAGAVSKAGRPLRPALKIYMGLKRGDISTVFYADVMTFENLEELVKRMPKDAREWAVPLAQANKSDREEGLRYGFVRSQSARGMKGAYVRNSFVVVNASRTDAAVSILGVVFVVPLKYYPSEKPNAPDLKGYWNGPDNTGDDD